MPTSLDSGLCLAYLELAKLGSIEDADAAVVHVPGLVQGVVEMRLELPFEAGFQTRGAEARFLPGKEGERSCQWESRTTREGREAQLSQTVGEAQLESRTTRAQLESRTTRAQSFL